tara:strand:+ start:1828 stop:2163 length:336 start_codon:yes stop_codon:yes gene_type:complete
MNHLDLLECYKDGTDTLTNTAKAVVLDIITRIDGINQLAKADVIIYADSQIIIERHVLGEISRWLAAYDPNFNYHEGIHVPSEQLPFYWMVITSDVVMLTLKTKSEINQNK